MLNNSLNLIELMDWAAICKTDDEIKSYKMRLFYEYFNEDLRDEVNLRKEVNSVFTNEEMMTLLYNMVDTLAELQKMGKIHGEVSTKFIFCSKNRNFKIAEMMDSKIRYPLNVIQK